MGCSNMSNKKRIITTIFFNLFEVVCTVLLGLLFKFSYWSIFIILSTWICIRLLLSAIVKVRIKHYKSPFKCFIATTLLFISIYLANKIDLIIGLFVIIYSAIFTSNLGNVGDIFEWYNNGDKRSSKYRPLIEFVRNDPNNAIVLEYEKFWNNNYPMRYEVFVEFFRKRKKYSEIISHLSVKHNTIIKQECKIIFASLEVPLNLKPLK